MAQQMFGEMISNKVYLNKIVNLRQQHKTQLNVCIFCTIAISTVEAGKPAV